MQWEDSRGSGRGTGRAVRLPGDGDSAKLRRDESAVREAGSRAVHGGKATRSFGGRLAVVGAVTGVAVIAVGGAVFATLGGDDGEPAAAGGSDAPPGSAAASASPTPAQPSEPAAPPAPPIADTQPTGRYSITRTLVALEQTNPDTNVHASVGDIHRFIWTFRAKGACTDVCTGSVRSDAGAVYRYTWDGAALNLTREPVTQTDTCGGEGPGGPTGTAQSRSTFVFGDASVTASPSGRPSGFTVSYVETGVSLPETATEGCDLSSFGTVTFTYDFVATGR